MTDDLDNHPGFINVATDFFERRRISGLTNEQLVREYLKIEDGDDELHVNAMMDRLWPDWHKHTGGEDLRS